MMHTTQTVTAVLALALLGSAVAQQPLPTLNDARKAVRNGTTPGFVIIPARKLGPPEAAAASPATAAAAPAAPIAAPQPVSAALPQPQPQPQPLPTASDARKAVREGTTPGIVIIPARNPVPPEAAASSPTSAPKAGMSFFEEVRRNFPPSGRSLQSARRLDGPDVGIALPTQGASAPASGKP